MKTKPIIFFIILNIAFISVFSQKENNLSINKNIIDSGDTITFILDNLGGSVQWQESYDLVNWINIAGQTNDSLIIVAESTKSIRANVVYGNCDPYSSTIYSLHICPDSIIDFKGNYYSTALIGNQCWMTENLRSTYYANGSVLVDGTDAGNIILNTHTKYYFDYNDDPQNLIPHGKLYTWAAIMNNEPASISVPSGVRGVCPNGWHLPSDEEWKILEGTADSQYDYPDPTWDNDNTRGFDVGLNLKSTNGWNNNGTDLFEFNAKPSGIRYSSNVYAGLGSYTFYWSTSEESTSNSWVRRLNTTSSGSYRGDSSKSHAYSVRCIKDSIPFIANEPTISIDTIFDITQTTVTIGSEATNIGANAIISRGLCINTTGNPSLLDVVEFNGLGLGSFITSFSGLLPNTTYYVKAFATNSQITGYSNEISFTTLDIIGSDCTGSIIDFDGNSYNVVQIGDQCWMKENLRSTHYSNGDSIPYVEIANDWSNLGNSDPGFCYFNNDSMYINQNGLLYNWGAVMKGVPSSNNVPSGVQGICTDGWHVPSDEEWKILEGNTDSQYGYPDPVWDAISYRGFDAAFHLKSSSGWVFNGNGLDLYGFTIIPASYRNNYGIYGADSTSSAFWTSTELNIDSANYRTVFASQDRVSRVYRVKQNGYSVRCVKDSINMIYLPTVNIDNISGVTQVTSSIEGSIMNNGGTNILSKGICWNTTGSPTLLDLYSTDSIYGSGDIIIQLDNLVPSTTYYIRSFATNTLGTGYSNEVVIETLSYPCGFPITDVDGNNYNTVLIGNQCWMTENLRTTHLPDGTAIPFVTSSSAWDILEYYELAYCSYENSSANASTYGYLYTWPAAMNSHVTSSAVPSGVQGICPNGWHLPSDEEWKILEGEVDTHYGYPNNEWNGSSYNGWNVGLRLKATSGWTSNPGNGNGTDNYGFSALPGGYCNQTGSFSSIGVYTRYWTSTKNSISSSLIIYRGLNSSSDQIYRAYASGSGGESVRCVKD